MPSASMYPIWKGNGPGAAPHDPPALKIERGLSIGGTSPAAPPTNRASGAASIAGVRWLSGGLKIARYPPLASNTNVVPCASTTTRSPSDTSPARIRLASAFSNRCWITRFSGRAP